MKKQKTGAKSPKTPKKGKGKEMRVWEDQFAAGDEREFNKGPDVDLSSSGEKEEEILDQLDFDVESDMVTYEGDEDELDEHIKKGREARLKSGAKEKDGSKGRSAAAGMWSFFGGIALGGRELTRSDIEPVVAKFGKHLQEKNVAVDITERLCESVTESLVGKKLGTFEGVSRAVKASLRLHQAFIADDDDIKSSARLYDLLRSFKKTLFVAREDSLEWRQAITSDRHIPQLLSLRKVREPDSPSEQFSVVFLTLLDQSFTVCCSHNHCAPRPPVSLTLLCCAAAVWCS